MLIVYWPITIKFRTCEQTSKPQTNYRCCLWFSYLAPYWLISRNTITFHKYFWCSRFCEFHSKYTAWNIKQNRVLVCENKQIVMGIKITINLANILERNRPAQNTRILFLRIKISNFSGVVCPQTTLVARTLGPHMISQLLKNNLILRTQQTVWIILIIF